MLVLWTRFACFARYIPLFHYLVCSDISWKSVYKWCRFVKTMHNCQNTGGFKMSKWCRYVKTLQVYFVKMVQVQKNFGRRRTWSYHHLFSILPWLLSVASVQSSKARIGYCQQFYTNVYLRDGTSLVNLLRLFCPLYSFVLLLPINRLDSSTIRLQILSVTSDNVTYLRIAAT